MQIVYNLGDVGSINIRRYFEAEVRLLSRLPPHPNILHIYDHFIDLIDSTTLQDWNADRDVVRDHTMIIITQLFSCSLLEMVQIRKQQRARAPFFSTAEFLTIAIGLADAFVHLQRNNVVHRDVKAGKKE